MLDDKITIYEDGCPDDIPQLDFDVVVHEPDPNAANIRARKNGEVKAYFKGDLAGELLFGFVSDEVLMTRMKTVKKFRCRGCARQMYDALVAHFPDNEVKDGASSNDPVGDVVLGRWRGKGILKMTEPIQPS